MTQPDDAHEAVFKVEAVLGADLYAVAPKADYFLAESLLLGAAGMLITWFLEGLAKEPVETLGKTARKGLIAKLRNLINRGEKRSDREAADAAAAEVERAAALARSNNDPASFEYRIATITQELKTALVEAGMPQAAAVRYAETVRSASSGLVGVSP